MIAVVAQRIIVGFINLLFFKQATKGLLNLHVSTRYIPKNKVTVPDPA